MTFVNTIESKFKASVVSNVACMYIFMQNLFRSEGGGGADSKTEEVGREADENHSSITHREQPTTAHTSAEQSGKCVNASF